MLLLSFLLSSVPVTLALPARSQQYLGSSSDGVLVKSPDASVLSSYSDLFGIRTYGSVPPARCWAEDQSRDVDVAILGAPFDTATTYRPGARFGPNGIRQGSTRMGGWMGYNTELAIDPFKTLDIVDCGDVKMSLFDNVRALTSLEEAYRTVLSKSISPSSKAAIDASPALQAANPILAKDGKHHPKLVTLGGDHTVVLPILKALSEVYGPISVVHADSHQDTYSPERVNDEVMADPQTDYKGITHGTMLWRAAQSGYISNGTSIHAGLRSPLFGPEDYTETDDSVGFSRIEAWEIDDIGTKGVVERIRARVGSNPVYLTIDIDTLDPAQAPATGTPEPGGWTMREMKRILHGLKDLNIVGMDVVEVAPMYDTPAEVTVIAAAKLINEMLSIWALQSGKTVSNV